MNGIVNVLGVEIHNLTRPKLFAQLQAGVVTTPNTDMIMKMRHDPAFYAACHAAEFRVCDSKIVQFASYFLGTPIRERIAGSDLFGELCALHRDDPQWRVFLLGAGPGVAAEAQRRVNARLGREVVIGAHSPSFGFEKNEAENAAIVDLINRSGATVLAVGVGAPKQEKWIMRHRARLPGVQIFLAIGATIDFEAGNIPRAPRWMRDTGLEWAYRLYCEPRRLWRRYLIDDMPFFWCLLRQRLGLDRFSRGAVNPHK